MSAGRLASAIRRGGGSRPALALALVSLLLAVGASPARAATPRLVTGIAGIGVYDPEIFAQARTTEARLVRLVLPWEDIAPEQAPAGWQPENPADPHYDWSYVDRGVTQAVAAGFTPLLVADGAPSWVQRCAPRPDLQATEICDPDPAALRAFAKAAAARYSGHFGGLPRVRYFQGLNEPNLTLFFLPQFSGGRPVSPALYRNLINAFYAGVKSVDRSNVVLAAGLGPIAVPKWTIGPMRFARKLLCMTGSRRPRPTKGDCGGGVRFDVFDIHPYTTGGPTHRGGPADVQLGDIAKLQRLLHAADRAGRIKGRFKRTPLWVTEFSWDSKPPDPGGLPMKILGRWTAEALFRCWRAGVTHFFWYSLRDDPYEPERPFNETLQAGLFFRGATVAEDRPKRVFYVFRFPFVAYPRAGGLFFWGRTPQSAGGRVAIQVRRHGRWRGVAVARANRAGIFRGTVRIHYGRNRRGFVRAVYRGQAAVPFSMRPVKDFRQPPFG